MDDQKEEFIVPESSSSEGAAVSDSGAWTKSELQEEFIVPESSQGTGLVSESAKASYPSVSVKNEPQEEFIVPECSHDDELVTDDASTTDADAWMNTESPGSSGTKDSHQEGKFLPYTRLEPNVLVSVEGKTLEDCFVGKKLQIPCHNTTFRKTKTLLLLSELSEMEQFLLKNRTGIDVKPGKTICYSHKQEITTDYFAMQERTCCDPFGLHLCNTRKNPKKKPALKIITLQKQKEVLNKLGMTLICGKKICFPCLKVLNKKMKEKAQACVDFVGNLTSSAGSQVQFHSINHDNELHDTNDESSPTKNQKSNEESSSSENEKSNDSDLDYSENAYEEMVRIYGHICGPVHKKKIQRLEYAQEKLMEIQRHAQDVVQRASGLRPEQLLFEKNPKYVKIPVQELQEKIQTLTRHDICEVLTLLPEDQWPLRTVETVFGVTRRLAVRARNERRENGILPNISVRIGKRKLPKENKSSTDIL